MAPPEEELLTENDDAPLAPSPGTPETTDAPPPNVPARVQQQRQTVEPEIDWEIVDDDGQLPPSDRQPGTEGRLTEHDAGEGTYLDQQRQSQIKRYTADEVRAMPPQERMALWGRMSRDERNQNRALRRHVERDNRRRSETENSELRGEVARLSEQVQRLAPLGPQLDRMDEQRQRDTLRQLTDGVADANRAKLAAERKMTEALTAQDNDAFIAALNERDSAFVRSLQLETQRKNLEAHLSARRQSPGARVPSDTRQPPQDQRADVAPQDRQPQGPRMTERGIELRDDFLADHDWIDVRRPDEASKAILRIDAEMVAEGWDPNRPEYYQELEDRAAEIMPHKFGEARPAANGRRPNGNGTRPAQPNGGARPGPAVPTPQARAPNAQRRTVKLTPERKEALIEVGVLDRNGAVLDKAKLGRYLAQYDTYDRANPAQAGR